MFSLDAFIYDVHTDGPYYISDAQPYDIITYWNDNYTICFLSGVIVDIDSDGNILCESKWEDWGLYRHELSYVPLNYANYDNVTNKYYINTRIFRYEQDEHDLYMYEDNDEDGCIVKCSASKYGNDCSHTIICDEDPSYGATASGHYASCLNGHFSFFEEHTDTESVYYDLYHHKTSCEFCGYYYFKLHTWVTYGTKYRCLDCGHISNQAPSIMQNVPPIDETTEVEIPIVEGEETVASLPPVNDEEEYTE